MITAGIPTAALAWCSPPSGPTKAAARDNTAQASRKECVRTWMTPGRADFDGSLSWTQRKLGLADTSSAYRPQPHCRFDEPSRFDLTCGSTTTNPEPNCSANRNSESVKQISAGYGPYSRQTEP